MFMKALYGACLGIIAFTLFFIGPSGWSVTKASPQKVKRDGQKYVGRSGSRHRGPRYVFIGGYYRGK